MKTVRDGQIVWPFCTRCGCRLDMFKEKDEFFFRHYPSSQKAIADLLGIPEWNFRDARGCACIDEIWSLEDRILYQGVV